MGDSIDDRKVGSRKIQSGPSEIHFAWWKKTSYGSGRQSFPVSAELSNPFFMPGFSGNEMWVFYTLTFIAWKKQNWLVPAAIPFLEAGLQQRKIKRSTIMEALKHLTREGTLGRILDKKNGNNYLVAPNLMRIEVASGLANYDKACRLRGFHLTGAVVGNSDYSTLESSEFQTTDIRNSDYQKKVACLESSEIQTNSIDIKLSLGVAPSHSLTDEAQGGEESPTRSPNGHDQRGQGNKGVLTDTIKEKLSLIYAGRTAELI